jgi:hypothetical protein
MKTTIEIPESLYKMAKIRAIERGQTLKHLVLTSLEKELGVSVADEDPRPSYWANRKLLPEFQRLSENGLMKLAPGDRSIDDIVSDIKADPEL